MEADEPFAPCTRRREIARLQGGKWIHAQDDLADEVPIALEYNGISHAVMLATPADLEEFAIGFSLSEGIAASANDIYDIETEASATGITLHVGISSAAFMQLKERRRNLTGRTGCGLCGTESLDQVMRPLSKVNGKHPLSAAGIRRALVGLKLLQPLNRITGGTHAAAWSTPDGELRIAFEDVGRHNALDKLIGAITKAHIDAQDGFVVMTSRASVELVQKAATVGIPALVAISAPTALAVKTADGCGMTLVAFARGDEFVGYAHCDDIILD